MTTCSAHEVRLKVGRLLNGMKRIISLAIVALLAVSCSAFTYHIKPLPAGARSCASDYDCSDNQHCGFPDVDTHPQCLPGAGSQYEVPPTQ